MSALSLWLRSRCSAIIFGCAEVAAARRVAPAEREVQEAPAVVPKAAELGLGAPESPRPRDWGASCPVWARLVWPRLCGKKDSAISWEDRHLISLERCLIKIGRASCRA